MRRPLLPLLAGLLSPVALAADPLWFEIELIAFKRDNAEHNERWPEQVEALARRGTIDLITPVLRPRVQHLKAMLPSCTEPVADPYTFDQSPIHDLSPLTEQEPQFDGFSPLQLQRFKACQFPEETDWLFHHDNDKAVGFKSRRVITSAMDRHSNQPYLLDKQSLQMTKMAQKIRWFKGTTPLLHLGWRQPVYARHRATPFYLFGGEEFSDRYQGNGAPIASDAPYNFDALAARLTDTLADAEGGLLSNNALNNPPGGDNSGLEEVTDPADESFRQDPLWELEGVFKVYLNHYLFIETQFNRHQEGTRRLAVNAQTTDTDNQPENSLTKNESMEDELAETVPWLLSYPFKQHRRVRSKEIHYFDHPKMGIVVQIRRVKRS